jgi:hypothetical protein
MVTQRLDRLCCVRRQQSFSSRPLCARSRSPSKSPAFQEYHPFSTGLAQPPLVLELSGGLALRDGR